MKTNKAFIKGINWVLAGILTMLGFAGCDIIPGQLEYGTPYADYTVKGTVVDKTTGKPVKGIRMGYGYPVDRYPNDRPILEYGTLPISFELKKQVTTDENGRFNINDRSFTIPDNMPIRVRVEDIDGVENGSFQPQDLYLYASDATHTGKSDGWYGGEYNFTVNVELTETEAETENQ